MYRLTAALFSCTFDSPSSSLLPLLPQVLSVILWRQRGNIGHWRGHHIQCHCRVGPLHDLCPSPIRHCSQGSRCKLYCFTPHDSHCSYVISLAHIHTLAAYINVLSLLRGSSSMWNGAQMASPFAQHPTIGAYDTGSCLVTLLSRKAFTWSDVLPCTDTLRVCGSVSCCVISSFLQRKTAPFEYGAMKENACRPSRDIWERTCGILWLITLKIRL